MVASGYGGVQGWLGLAYPKSPFPGHQASTSIPHWREAHPLWMPTESLCLAFLSFEGHLRKCRTLGTEGGLGRKQAALRSVRAVTDKGN